MTFRSFIILLTILTACIAIVIAAVNFLFPFFLSIQIFTWSALLFFFVLTIITGYMGFRSLEKSPHGFVASVNGIVLLKLAMSIAFIVACLLIAKPDKPNFIISFFILYIIYTVFEVRQFIIVQKRKIQQEKLSQNANG
jgi:hypothetical protein